MNLAKLEFHEIANEFPLVSAEESEQLADDIKKNGLLEPLVLYQEKVLDGRNRFNACKRIGLKLSADDVIQFEEAYEGEDPVLFVISKNIRRRHLTVGQRSACAAELFKRMEKQKTGPKIISEPIGPETPDRDERLSKAASVTGVSPRSVARAASVLSADPELHEEVRAGTKTLHQATQEVRRKKAEKVEPQERDEAEQKILKICGEKFWSAMMAKKMAGLKTGIERVMFADRPAAELKVLSAIMYWGELTVAEALEFKKKKLGKPVSKEWRLQDLMAFMREQNQYQQGFVTEGRTIRYRVTIERWVPMAGQEQEFVQDLAEAEEEERELAKARAKSSR